MKILVNKSQARQFLLKKQLLFPPYSLTGARAIEAVFQHLRIIQYDPLNPCGRNPDLVLQSRIRDYHPGDYQHWLYREKKGIEGYDKELCIVPLEDFALTNIRRTRMKDHLNTKMFLKKYQKQIEALLLRIEEKGEISSSDIKDLTRVDSGWGTDALFGRIALETLWRMGRLVISRRDKGRKYYDLPTNVHHELIAEKERAVLTREHVKRRLQSVGLLPLSGGGGGWQGLGPVRAIIKQLVEDGEFIEITISGIDRIYVIAKNHLNQIQKKGGSLKQKQMTFIAPLDNLMWDRQMIEELFDFHYRWEVYTPLTKRKYGYYVLPILYGDELIGRIEPVLTKDKQLEVRGLWKEDEKQWDSKVESAFTQALEQFRKYVNATEIIRLR